MNFKSVINKKSVSFSKDFTGFHGIFIDLDPGYKFISEIIFFKKIKSSYP